MPSYDGRWFEVPPKSFDNLSSGALLSHEIFNCCVILSNKTGFQALTFKKLHQFIFLSADVLSAGEPVAVENIGRKVVAVEN